MADAVSISLAGVSTIACIIALGVLLYYKMWHSFIYRLVLYMFISYMFFSLTTMLDNVINTVADEESNLTIKTFIDFSVSITGILRNGIKPVALMLVTSLTVCIYLMALHNYQFTYRSDLCLLISSILYSMITLIWIILSDFKEQNYPWFVLIHVLILDLPFFVNVVFTALTLVPLCCRACGYNLCMKTAATIESHRKALREILPLFFLIVPSFLFFLLYLMWLFDGDNLQDVLDSLYTIPGLISASSFALHLCFVRKNLNKLRGKTRTSWTSKYGSVNQCRTHRTAVFTSEAISETCNTEPLSVSEDEEDSRFLLRNNHRELSESFYLVT